MQTERTSRGASTLPAEYYTSREIHDRETERIFDRRWLCVGLAAEAREPGDYFVADIEGESVLVVRDRAGAIRAYYNVCRHRGTRLCGDADSGSFSNYIVCPYHSWAYQLSGELAAAPNMQEVEGFDAAELPLHALAVTVWEGLVFVSFAAEPVPFQDDLAGLSGRFGQWGIADLVPVHRIDYDVNANWKLLFQNYSECYHCPTLHPVLNRLTPYRNTGNDLDEGPVLGGPMQMSEGVESMTMNGRACAAPLGGAAPAADGRALAWYYTVLPSMFLSLLPDYVLIHRLVRCGPVRTTVVCQWLFHPDAVAGASFDPSGAIEFWDLTNRQDWGIVERSQAGFGSRAYRPGPYSNLESLLAAFDRDYLEAMR